MSKINTRPVTVEGKRYSLSIVDGKIMGASELDQPNSLAKPVDSRTLNKIVADDAILDVYNGAVHKGDSVVTDVSNVQLGSAEERGQFFTDQDKKFRNAQFVAEENIKQEKSNIAFAQLRDKRQRLNQMGKFSSEIFQYPLGFDTNQDHLKITRHEYRRPEINASKSGNVTMKPAFGKKSEQYNSAGDTVAGTLLGSILLPMPKVADVNGVEWGKSELNINGLTALGAVDNLSGIALTKIDVLDDFDDVSICIDYGAINYETFDVKDIEIITMPGWKSSTVGITDYEKLPKNAKAYIETIEKLANISVDIISTGPARNEIIQKINILDEK